jgi:hypothetical protein
MLVSYCLRHTSRRLIINTSRSTFSTLPYPKSSETKAGTDGTSSNFPEFYNTGNPDRIALDDLKKSKTNHTDSVPHNDVLEAQRIEKEQKTDKKLPPVVTSTEKFAAGLSPIQATSSITPDGIGLFHDAKVSNTPISPGIPIVPNIPQTTTNLPPITNEEQLRKDDQIPSSPFSAFLRGISSGLPFFPSRKTTASPIDIATTREYFIPVCLNHYTKSILIIFYYS